MSHPRRQYGSGYGKAVDSKPDIRLFLDRYNVDYNETNGWQPVRCPNPDHVDLQASCSLSLGEQKMKCHSCEFSGDVYDLIGTVLDFDYQASRRIAESVVAERGGPDARGTAGEPSEYLPGGSSTRPRFRRTAPARLRREHGHYGA